jgi:hypothetical protein
MLEEFLTMTIGKYLQHQKKDRDYNEWNDAFFTVLSDFVLRLPESTAKEKFFEPILKNWEKASSLMELFLFKLTSAGSEPLLRDRFADLLVYVGDRILASNKCMTAYYNDSVKSILAYLVLSDPFIKWQVTQWAPLAKMTDFIGRWCSVVGSQPACFPSLIKLLSTIGFPLMTSHGISWLYNIVNKVSDRKKFLADSRATNKLAELLHDSWSKMDASITGNPGTQKQFLFLVSITAEQGNSLAIALQRKIQEALR